MKRALELYCGGGGVCMGMLSVGWSVVGIDRDARMLKGYPGLALCADVFALRAAPVGFDLIWASPACQG